MNGWDKCAWCGGYNPNVTLDQKGSIQEVRPCNKCSQPERSKREDSQSLISDPVSKELRRKEDQLIEEMRYSEHCGNTVREVQ